MTADRPTPPSPMTTTDAPGRTRAVSSNRPDAGRHGTADQRGDLGRRVRVDGDRGLGGHDLRRTERSDAAVRADGRAIVAVDAHEVLARSVARADRSSALPALAAQARRAGAAGRGPGEHDERAQAKVGEPFRDAGPDRRHDRRSLVAQHDVDGPRPLAVHDVQVRVADAAREHPDRDLAGGRRVEAQCLQCQRFSWPAKDQAADRLAHAPLRGLRTMAFRGTPFAMVVSRTASYPWRR